MGSLLAGLAFGQVAGPDTKRLVRAAVGLARVFFAGNVGYAVGLYFIALIPTSGMTAAWTGLAGGDPPDRTRVHHYEEVFAPLWCPKGFCTGHVLCASTE